MSHLLSNFLIWQNIGQGKEGEKERKYHKTKEELIYVKD